MTTGRGVTDDASTHTSGDRSPTGLGRERTATAAVGATLLALGLRRRSWLGAATALAGGWLLFRGLSRERPLGRASAADTEETAGAAETERSITVGRSAEELHDLWRDPDTAASVFGEFVEVTAPSEDRRRWSVSGPFGRTVTWETRVTEDRHGESIRWESVDAAVPSEGSIRFRPAPDDRGTEVTFQFRFDPPGGSLGEAVAERLSVVPGTLAEKVLDRFKSLAETGEIPTLERNPSARGRGDLL